jgi:glyoxylase-like metal-dependent hydrolase (beta-lactamase superfamily II)
MRHRPLPLPRRQLLLGVAAAGAAALVSRPAAGAATSGHPPGGTRQVGAWEVVPLRDATGPFFQPLQEAFAGASPADWERARRIDPGAFGPRGTWVLDFRCYAIRRPDGETILVDTGVGPAGSLASDWAPVPGRLPRTLREHGIDPRHVGTVVLTHLHGDHVGWAVRGDGTPMFPNARHVLQRAETAALTGGGEPVLGRVVEPLRRAGLLREVDGPARLAKAGRGTVTAVPTPGHTPGHQSVLVRGGDQEVVVTGDVLVHAVQLADPDVTYAFEADQETARATRRALLSDAHQHRSLLATAHLTEPFVKVP